MALLPEAAICCIGGEDLGIGDTGELPGDQPSELRIIRKLQFFDGARAHQTTPFNGRRTTLTWYSTKDSWRVHGNEVQQDLNERYGFDVASETNRSSVIPAPLGYWHQLSKEQRALIQGSEQQRDLNPRESHT